MEDDTIRDQMESGYVATRPRYTRTRRTWKVNVRNLVAEDIRAIDQFAMVTAARGANSFLYPNLLPNGSFELPAPSVTAVAQGWGISSMVAQESVDVTTSVLEDGTRALSFSTAAGQSLPANSTVTAQVSTDQRISCGAGEVYVFRASADVVQGTLTNGILGGAVTVVFFGVNGNVLSTQSTAVAVGVGWQEINFQFTVPANATTFAIQLSTSLTNTTVAAIPLDGSSSITWDALGCALRIPLTPFGRMAGSQSLGCPVRFSKLPEASDVGVGQGVKRYGVSFELTEV